MVPSGAPAGAGAPTRLPSAVTSVPWAAPRSRVISLTLATDAMLGSASPRKPRVVMENRSSARDILLVACRAKARDASSRLIPHPSSDTEIISSPPPATSTRTARAPASIEFSTSSFTTEAGRSTTSPAAILSATSGESFTMRMPNHLLLHSLQLVEQGQRFARR